MNCTRCGKFKTNDSILCSDCQTPETRMHQMPDPQSMPFTREYYATYAPTDQASYQYPAWQTGTPPFAPGQAQRKNSRKIAVTITLIVLSLVLLAAMIKAILFFNGALANSSDLSNAKISEGSSVSAEAKIPEPPDAVPATEPPDPVTKPSEPVSRTAILQSPDGKIQITLPEGWQEDQTLSKRASLRAGNEEKSMFVVVFTDDKKDFRPTTIEKYDEIGLKYFLKPEVSRQIKSRRKTTVNGYPALQSEVLGVSEERNLIYLHTTVETPGAFYEIVAWTRPSLYESNLLMIQEIIQSFRENGQ